MKISGGETLVSVLYYLLDLIHWIFFWLSIFFFLTTENFDGSALPCTWVLSAAAPSIDLCSKLTFRPCSFSYLPGTLFDQQYHIISHNSSLFFKETKEAKLNIRFCRNEIPAPKQNLIWVLYLSVIIFVYIYTYINHSVLDSLSKL